MKATKTILFSGAAAVLAAGLALAAAPQGQAPAQGHGCSGMAQRLQLTDQQKAQIQPIREKYRAQFQKLHEQEMNDISRVLTPQQRQQLQQLREQRQQRMGQRGWGGQGRAMAGRHGRMMARVAQELNLTQEQRDKVRGVLQSHRTDFQNLRQQAQASGADRTQVRQQARALREKVVAEIRPILTTDQWNKLQTLMQQHMGQRRQG